MKTFVLWTHYDCDVYATLHSSQLDAYQYLASGWLDDCSEDDCGHGDDMRNRSVEEISEALAYHFDELSYDINEMEVPLTTAEQIQENSKQLLPESAAPVTILDEQAVDLMSRLESFSHE